VTCSSIALHYGITEANRNNFGNQEGGDSGSYHFFLQDNILLDIENRKLLSNNQGMFIVNVSGTTCFVRSKPHICTLTPVKSLYFQKEIFTLRFCFVSYIYSSKYFSF
jgi:hypothetical protein